MEALLIMGLFLISIVVIAFWGILIETLKDSHEQATWKEYCHQYDKMYKRK